MLNLFSETKGLLMVKSLYLQNKHHQDLSLTPEGGDFISCLSLQLALVSDFLHAFQKGLCACSGCPGKYSGSTMP